MTKSFNKNEFQHQTLQPQKRESPKRSFGLKNATIVLLLLLSVSCNKKTDKSTDTSSDASALDLVAASTNIVAEGLSSMETNPTTMATKDASIFNACSSLTAPSCTSKTMTIDFGGCTKTNNNGVVVTRYGTSNLSFTGNLCSMSAANDSVTRTFSGHYITVGALGGKILVYTNTDSIDGTTIAASDLLDYAGQSHSGGTTLTNTDGGSNYTLSIGGVHRKRIKASGASGFWHTLYTTTPLSVSNSGTVKTLNGTVNVAHNIIGVTASTTFNNTTYDTTANCCYPTGGSISYQAGSVSSTFTFSSTCGDVSIDGGAATSLPACGGSSQ